MTDPALKTLADLEWPRLLAALADRCSCDAGATQARALPLEPDRAAVSARFALVEEAVRLAEEGPAVELGSVKAIGPLLERTRLQGPLDAGELRDVADTLGAACDAARRLAGRRALFPLLAERLAPARSLEAVVQSIRDKFADDGTLADHASPELRRTRQVVATERARVVARIEELMHRHRELLQDSFYTVREDRYVLPVRADAHERVPGIVHGTSASGATVFVEPRAVVGMGNRLKMAAAEADREEARILAALSAEVGAHADAAERAAAAATMLDVLLAVARLARDLEAHIPRLSTEPLIDLRAARHPLLALGGKAVVPNDLRLEPGRALVVSGPNAGGKTVALKTAGLFALMVRAGLPLPIEPEHGEIGIFADVFTDVGDEQSLSLSLSTFSAHLTNLGRILTTATFGHLVLLDEIAAGTDPDEGSALARAILESLCDRGATCAVTTHYPTLKEAATTDPRFVNASVGFDVARMSPSFVLTLGVPGASVALAIAARFGIPDAVVVRARSFLGEGTVSFQDAVERLQAARALADAEAVRARSEREAAEEARRSAEAELERARVRDQKAVSREAAEVVEAVRRAREEVEQARLRVRRRRVRDEDLVTAKKALETVAPAVAPGGVLSQAAAPAAPQSRPALESELVQGAEVWVPSLGGKGRVVEPPRKGKVRVALGALGTTVDVGSVRILVGGARPAPAKPRASEALSIDPAADPTDPIQTPENTCDLRGLRAEEALEQGERFLDQMMREGRQCAFLIHGHGTGVLRVQVRERLGKSRYVARFRPGHVGEGGDGVTVFWLK